MKRSVRATALLLAVAMCIGLLCAPAGADETIHVTTPTVVGDFVIDSAGTVTEYRGAGGAVTLPGTAVAVGANVFKGKNITEVKMPTNVTSYVLTTIGENAFRDCKSLSKLEVPSTLTTIGSGAFAGCGALDYVIIPDRVTKISNKTFANCTSLSEITIFDSVTSIADDAFEGCGNLTIHGMPGSEAEKYASKYKNITFVGDGNYYLYLWNKTTVIKYLGSSGIAIVPDQATGIGEEAFLNRSVMTFVRLPEKVAAIGESAFAGCKSLAHIVILDNAKSIADNAFTGCPASLTIHGKAGSYAETYAEDHKIKFVADGETFQLEEPEPEKPEKPEQEDTFQFDNSRTYFSSYRINNTYLTYLKGNEPRSYQAYIDQMNNRTWQGSCFGMSAVYCMARSGGIDLSVFQPDAEHLRDLAAPNRTQGVQDLVNYYMMTQCTREVSDYTRRYSSTYQNRQWVKQNVNEQIVKELQTEPGYSLLAFSFSGGGHAVVAKRLTSDTNGYHIAIWDPNYPDKEGELVISANFASALFTSSSTSGGYNNGLRLMYVLPYTTRAQSYDAKNLQKVYSQRSVSAGSTFTAASTSIPACILTSSVGNFTLTTGDGRTAVVRNGEPLSTNTLSLLRFSLAVGQDSTYRYYIHEDDAKYGFAMTLSGGSSSEVQYVSDDFYTRVNAANLTDVTVQNDKVTTACSTDSYQTVTLVSDKLAAARDQITVTGMDTSMTLGVENSEVRVSTAKSNVVTVRASNVTTQGSSGSYHDYQTLATDSVGVLATVTASANQNPNNPYYPNYNPNYNPPAASQGSVIGHNTAPGQTSGSSASSGSQTGSGQSWSTPSSGSSYYSPFTDVSRNDEYFYPVVWAQRKGVTNGYNGSTVTFAPDASVSRGEAVTFLWRLNGSPTPKGTFIPFSDVGYSSYCAQAVLWAVEQGITNGCGSPTTFVPEKKVSRGEMVTFLWRALGKPGGPSDGEPFADVKANSYCAPAVRWAAKKGVAAGYGSAATFAPNAPVDRAETVSFMWRAAGCPKP